MGRCYPVLNLEDRRKLTKWLEAKIPIKEIATICNVRRRRSTVRSDGITILTPNFRS